MRILIAEALSREGVELLRARHEVDEAVGRSPDELRALVPAYDALVVRSGVKVDAPLIEAGTRLAVIGRAGVGVDNIDVAAATRAGITVVNAPTGNTVSAAELTIGLLFALARRLAAADASMRRGEWARSKLTGFELDGRTFGIVGFGKIGQAIAARVRGLGMRVVASDPFLTADGAARAGVELLELPALLATADVVSLHVPLTRSTKGLIGAAELVTMKRSAVILNVARGGVVDEAALAAALADGVIAGAGIDVYSAEPPAADNALLSAPNTVLTPHLGASTAEAQVRVAIETAEAVLDVLDGRVSSAAVNAALASQEAADAVRPYLSLATTLGSLLRQVAPHDIGEVIVETAGALAAVDPAPLVAATLLGALEPGEDRINLVNARAIAHGRGIRTTARRQEDAGAYASALTVSTPADPSWKPGSSPASSAERLVPVGGTIANGGPRLTRLGRFDVDLPPSAEMLVTHHHDRPGTMGRIGSLLGEAGVNIGQVHLARDEPRGDALMVLALDDTVSDSVAERIRADASVLDLWRLHLGPSRAEE
jgi:D-3-phosphoglycerate dehydrogenase